MPRLLVYWMVFSLVFGPLLPFKLAQSAPVRITLWHIATDLDPFRPVLQQAIDRFNATHPDIQFDAQAISNETFGERLSAALASGDYPDVFQTWGGAQLSELIEGGMVRDIPEMAGPGRDRFVPAGLASSTFDGKHYAIPANLAGIFLWYNDELFQRHGVELPTTWGKFLAACSAFRAAGVVPIALGNRDKWPGALWFNYLAARLGGPGLFQRAGDEQASGVFTDPAFIGAGARIQEAVRAGCFGEQYNDTAWGDAQTLLATGQASMQLQGDWNFGGLRRTNADLTDRNIHIMAFPAVEGAQPDQRIMVGGTGQAFAVAAKAPPQTASALLELLGSEEFGRSAAEHGFLPALTGFDHDFEHPTVGVMSRMLATAPAVQLYLDRALPAHLAQRHLDTTHALFALSITPAEAAQQMAEAAQRVQSGQTQEAPQAFPTMPDTLRYLAERRNFLVGAAVAINPLRSEPQYAETLRREFNVLTAENVMKIGILHPDPDRYDFSAADELVRFAEQNGMQVRGHVLVYDRDLPWWLANRAYSRDEMITILRNHVQTVVSRYRGRIFAWDVVNEAIADDGSLRNTIWLRTIGPEYIELAFRWAREADPGALLFYNDYNNEGLDRKSDAVYSLVSDLVQRGVPIDGVGLQMHVKLATPPNLPDVAANMGRIASLGLQVHVSEMDVEVWGIGGTDQDRLNAQADMYRQLAQICLSEPACTALITWGFTDKYTWLGGTPLLFDAAYQPKPAYDALKEALSAE
jgi:endo-1,4-beta-xylanase